VDGRNAAPADAACYLAAGCFSLLYCSSNSFADLSHLISS
jgi:hypothetical protein